MLYTVTYRSNGGKRETAEIEAADRAGVFAELKRRGIAAISVSEGKAKPPKTTTRASSLRKTVAVAGILLLAVASILFVVQNDKAKPQTDAKPRSPRIAEVKFPLRPTAAKPKNAGISNDVKALAKDDGLPPNKRIVEMISVVTNADGSVLERFRTADGKTRSRQSAPKPVFDNASDQLLAAAVSGAESGAAMPPMPMMNNADEEFRKSLEKEIAINDDDSDSVKALKKSVIALREEMRQLLDEGHSFAEVLRDHREIVNHGVEMRAEAVRLVKEFMDDGDDEAARACLEKMNDTLAQMGIEGVEMPLSREERREAIRRQRKVRQ